MGASVEQSIDTTNADLELNIYFEEKHHDEEKRLILKNSLKKHLMELADLFNVKHPAITWKLIPDQDWSNNWKVYFRPFAIIPGLIIAPTWEPYRAKKGELVITLDPGMAFGTGHHATTSLALGYIRKILNSAPDLSVLDVGCGTGILGMAAALFGSSQVLGIDNDFVAVQVATENVALNNQEKNMQVAITPLQELHKPVNCIVANIIYDVLVSMDNDFYRLLTPGGHLILSGILHGLQEANIIAAFAKAGLSLQESTLKEEWAALYFTKS